MWQLKRKLQHPDKARDIISRLRRVQVEYHESQVGPPGRPNPPPTAHMRPRAVCLSKPFPPLPNRNSFPSREHLTPSYVPEHAPQPDVPQQQPQENSFVNLFTSFSISPEGYIVGAVADQASGVFDLLGGATGALLSNGQLSLPHDRITVISSWWGYEVAIPSSSMHCGS